MKIRLLSDIHLENLSYTYGHEFMEWILPPLDTDKDSVLVLAGDIFGFRNRQSQEILLDYIWDKFLGVVYVAGNHEYYDNDLNYANYFQKEVNSNPKTFTNFHFLNNSTVKIGEILFVGSTLWTNFNKNNPNAKNAVQFGLNDYVYIKNSGQKLTAEMIYREHCDSAQFIAKRGDKTLTPTTSFENPNKTVVVTHHLPSLQCIQPQYKNSGNINYGFASDLDNLIIDLSPKFWIFGHTHSKVDMMIHKTRLIANPLGYSNFRNRNCENKDFNSKLVLDI